VHLDLTRVRTQEGLVLVALTLECDQTGIAEVVVPFAVGTDEQPAGLVAVSETKPRGAEVLVDRWGEAIVATAWRALIEAATVVAKDHGSDLDGAPLRAGALIVGRRGIAVVPQAQHPFERLAIERLPGERPRPR
jgi:hypothetical protein